MRLRMMYRRAFTLVEVLMVLAIIGVAAAVIVPHMIEAGTLNVQAAGRLVIADLLYAQNDAIAQQEPRRVIFDQDKDLYRIVKPNGDMVGVNWKRGDAAVGNYLVDIRNDGRFPGITLENIAFGGDQIIEFDPLGGPDTGGSIDVVFKDTRYRINVAPMTGRVTIDPVN